MLWKQSNKEDLALLAERSEAGKVVPVTERSYPLSEVPEALRYLKEEPRLGKTVLPSEWMRQALKGPTAWRKALAKSTDSVYNCAFLTVKWRLSRPTHISLLC